ncbi:hypothetical protein HYU19_00325 [Candidatus Woesearchaeota archaeon]|nr:hypothetical protein [Candidatus Woesearchaeota archaeon]
MTPSLSFIDEQWITTLGSSAIPDIRDRASSKAKFINYPSLLSPMSGETVMVKRDAIIDLVRVKDEFDSIVESLELMADSEFMASYKKARQQVEKREFDDWDEL